jgi:serine/threonine protein kinase
MDRAPALFFSAGVALSLTFPRCAETFVTSRQIPEPGELLGERYRVVRLIGEGGMGAVLEAENTLTQKRVAIKLMNPSLRDNSEAVERLVREAQASCRIRHQNVVDVYDVVREKDALFLIMELLEGEPMSALLERGGVPAHEFIELVLQAMRGVAAAHRVGVIHRDIHPGNILLAREPPSTLVVPKVLDFGIAKLRDSRERSLTGSGVTMGTPLYMSYEQLCSARDIDARTDIYPFGVILYQGLTGQQPFAASVLTELLVKLATEPPLAPKQLAPEIPTALDRLICWALERDRDKRISSMDAFIDELEPFASARAFRTQMTDAQRTLPAIVPRALIEQPAARASDAPPRSSDLPPERLAEKTLEEVRVSDPQSAPALSPSLAPAKSRSRDVLPLAFAVAATLALMGLGTCAVRRLTSPAAQEGRTAGPPPLPVLDAGLSSAQRPDARRVVPLQPDFVRSEAKERDGGTAPIESSLDAPSARAALPQLAEPVPGLRPRAPKSRKAPEAPKRRFRAGEARPIDF